MIIIQFHNNIDPTSQSAIVVIHKPKCVKDITVQFTTNRPLSLSMVLSNSVVFKTTSTLNGPGFCFNQEYVENMCLIMHCSTENIKQHIEKDNARQCSY